MSDLDVLHMAWWMDFGGHIKLSDIGRMILNKLLISLGLSLVKMWMLSTTVIMKSVPALRSFKIAAMKILIFYKHGLNPPLAPYTSEHSLLIYLANSMSLSCNQRFTTS